MRPFFLALFLLLHGLAHAGAGIWATGRAPTWLVTPLWLVAMPGFLAAALAIFGMERLRPHAEGLTLAATLASAALLRLAGVGVWSLIGLMIGLAFCGLVRWWARWAHPEIRTPTLTTGDHPVIPEVPRLHERVGAGLGWTLLGYTALLIVLRPWYQEWGTRAAERAAPGAGEPSIRAVPVAPLGFYLLEPARFVIDRRMLLGIKARAERRFREPSHE